MSLLILSKKESETVTEFVKLLSTALEGCSGMLGDVPYVVVAGLHFLTWKKVVPVVELFCVFRIPSTASCKRYVSEEQNDLGSSQSFNHSAAYNMVSDEVRNLVESHMKSLPPEICGSVITETSASLMVIFHFRNCKTTNLAIALTPIITRSDTLEGCNYMTLLQGSQQPEWEDPERAGCWLVMTPPFCYQGSSFSWDLPSPTPYDTIADYKRLLSPSLLVSILGEARKWSSMGLVSPHSAIYTTTKTVAQHDINLVYKRNKTLYRVARLDYSYVMSTSTLSAREIDTLVAFRKLLNEALQSSGEWCCDQAYTVVAGLRFMSLKEVIPVLEILYVINQPFQDGAYNVKLSREDNGYYNFYRTAVKCGVKPMTFQRKVHNFLIGMVRTIIRTKMSYLPSVDRISLAETTTSLVVNFRFAGFPGPSVGIALTPAIAGTGFPTDSNYILQKFLIQKGKRATWWYLVPPQENLKLAPTSWEVLFPRAKMLVKNSNELVAAEMVLEYLAEVRQWPRMGLQSPHRAIQSLILWMDPDLLLLLSKAPLQEQTLVILERLQEAIDSGCLPDFCIPSRNYLDGTTKTQRSRIATDLKKGFVHLTPRVDHYLGRLSGENLSIAAPKLIPKSPWKKRDNDSDIWSTSATNTDGEEQEFISVTPKTMSPQPNTRATRCIRDEPKEVAVPPLALKESDSVFNFSTDTENPPNTLMTRTVTIVMVIMTIVSILFLAAVIAGRSVDEIDIMMEPGIPISLYGKESRAPSNTPRVDINKHDQGDYDTGSDYD